MSNRNLPTEPGLYWASKFPMLKEWELIARVWGQPPFLSVAVWNYLANRFNEIQSPARLYYGDKIEIPKRDPRFNGYTT